MTTRTLKDYAKHLSDCQIHVYTRPAADRRLSLPGPCSCGLDALLAVSSEPEQEMPHHCNDPYPFGGHLCTLHKGHRGPHTFDDDTFWRSAVVPAGETPQADLEALLNRVQTSLSALRSVAMGDEHVMGAQELETIGRSAVQKLVQAFATTEAEAFKAGWLADRSGNTGLWSFNGQGQCNEALFAEAFAAYRAQKGSEMNKQADNEAADKCPKCECPADEAHSCPYQSDINNDDEYQCTCCEHCQQKCRDDI